MFTRYAADFFATELGEKPLANVQVVNELVRHNSEHTCLVFLTLPSLPVSTNMTDDVADADVRCCCSEGRAGQTPHHSPAPCTCVVLVPQTYYTKIKELTFGLPATVLVASGGSSAFIASEI